MPTSTARQAIGERAPSELFEHVTCPFCGLLCDDLEVERNGQTVKLLKNGCPRAEAGFERRLPPSSPMVGAKEVELSKAVGEAAALIRKAALPLYGGLATDVDGMRAAMALAERSGGIVDHVLSDAQYTQFQGAADGRLDHLHAHRDAQPRRSDRHCGQRRAQAPPALLRAHRLPPRLHVRYGVGRRSAWSCFSARGWTAPPQSARASARSSRIPCALEDVGEVLSVLRARLHGSPVPPLDHLAGLSLADIDVLVERLRTAKYGVMVWGPPSKDFPRGELIAPANRPGS